MNREALPEMLLAEFVGGEKMPAFLRSSLFRKNWAKWETHKQYFKIEPTALLSLFEEMVQELKPIELEPSIKVVGQQRFVRRCVAYFGSTARFKMVLFQFFRFVKDVEYLTGQTLDLSILKTMVNFGWRLPQCQQLAIGIDDRVDVENSRIKFYFSLADTAQPMLERLGNYYFPNCDVARTQLIGVDMGLGGSGGVKFYPEMLGREMPASLLALWQQSEGGYLALRPKQPPMYHFEMDGNALQSFVPDFPLLSEEKYILGICEADYADKISQYNLYI